MTPVRLEPAAPLSRVKHSTTEPLRSLKKNYVYVELCVFIRLRDAMVTEGGHRIRLKEENGHFVPNLGLLIN